jgi:hypothetical protein
MLMSKQWGDQQRRKSNDESIFDAIWIMFFILAIVILSAMAFGGWVIYTVVEHYTG